MRHRKIQKKLLRYLDGDLPQDEEALVREHLLSCEKCASMSRGLKNLWGAGQPVPRVSAPPYLWTRLSARLEKEERKGAGAQRTNTLSPYIRAALSVAVIVATIFVGIQIGAGFLPPSEGEVFGENRGSGIEQELGMDYFSVMPPGSMDISILYRDSEEGSSR